MKRKYYEIITLLIYLLFFPILGYVTYLLYSNFVVIHSLSFIMKNILTFLIVGINLIAIYGLNFIIKTIPKRYFIANGVVINLLIILINVILIVCNIEYGIEVSKFLNLLKIMFLFSIAYTLVYLIMYSINYNDDEHACFDGKLVK